MDLRERLHYAKEEYIKKVEPYISVLVALEEIRVHQYILDTTTNKLTKVEPKKIPSEIWIENRIEEIRVSTYKKYNIEL